MMVILVWGGAGTPLLLRCTAILVLPLMGPVGLWQVSLVTPDMRPDKRDMWSWEYMARGPHGIAGAGCGSHGAIMRGGPPPAQRAVLEGGVLGTNKQNKKTLVSKDGPGPRCLLPDGGETHF